MLRVGLVTSSPLVREGLRALVAKQTDMQIVKDLVAARTTVEAIVDGRPDALAIEFAGSTAALMQGCAQARIGVVVLVKETSDRHVAQAWTLGATAVVPSDAQEEEIAAAIRDAAQGRKHVSPSVLRCRVDGSGVGALSDREREVFVLLVKGMSNVQIGQVLFISVRTVETHRCNIYRKLGAHNVADLVHAAYRQGVLDTGLLSGAGGST